MSAGVSAAEWMRKSRRLRAFGHGRAAAEVEAALQLALRALMSSGVHTTQASIVQLPIQRTNLARVAEGVRRAQSYLHSSRLTAMRPAGAGVFGCIQAQ